MKAFAITCGESHGRYLVGRTPEAIELVLTGQFEAAWAIPPVYIDTVEQREADPAVAQRALGIRASAGRGTGLDHDEIMSRWNSSKKPAKGEEAKGASRLPVNQHIDVAAVYAKWNAPKKRSGGNDA